MSFVSKLQLLGSFQLSRTAALQLIVWQFPQRSKPAACSFFNRACNVFCFKAALQLAAWQLSIFKDSCHAANCLAVFPRLQRLATVTCSFLNCQGQLLAVLPKFNASCLGCTMAGKLVCWCFFNVCLKLVRLPLTATTSKEWRRRLR